MSQNRVPLIGFLLVVLGVVTLAWAGMSYANQDKRQFADPNMAIVGETFPVFPTSGIIALAGGTALLVASRRKE